MKPSIVTLVLTIYFSYGLLPLGQEHTRSCSGSDFFVKYFLALGYYRLRVERCFPVPSSVLQVRQALLPIVSCCTEAVCKDGLLLSPPGAVERDFECQELGLWNLEIVNFWFGQAGPECCQIV